MQQTTAPEKDEEDEKGPKDNQYEDDEIDEANEEGRLQYRGGRSEKVAHFLNKSSLRFLPGLRCP